MRDGSVIVEYVYDAPVERVWHAITNVEKMRQWYFHTLVEFEPEVGFETMFDVTHNGKVFPHILKVTEVVLNKKISYEWKYGGYPGNSLVSFELFDEDGKTKIVLTHDKLETFRGDIHPDMAKQNFVQGWTHFIGTSLKEYVEQETEE
ncbi:SRPBCC domain-containing protein [Mucilaginibacter sp. OK098]|uniref:SRPBCC family protein n=1 Tax=Mucilaginibacter sp. OK098 TaxID=1855297 RepID=UPI0009154041|nr:SRPBCC family protein [Mucilaginibacter sp. OK098]SHM95277.1 Uncharacterized conserved protein YndB, AHSA1/START domain [Mucilaginibacter sp. OK098]